MKVIADAPLADAARVGRAHLVYNNSGTSWALTGHQVVIEQAAPLAQPDFNRAIGQSAGYMHGNWNNPAVSLHVVQRPRYNILRYAKRSR